MCVCDILSQCLHHCSCLPPGFSWLIEFVSIACNLISFPSSLDDAHFSLPLIDDLVNH